MSSAHSMSRASERIDLRTGQPYANLISNQKRFAATVADYFAVAPSDVVPASGATGAIEAVRNHVFRIAGKQHPVLLTVSPGYWRARESFQGFGFAVVDIKTMTAGFEVEEESLVREARKIQPDLLYLSLPNNPTGAIFDPARIVNGTPESAAIILDLTLPSNHLSSREVTGQLWRNFRGRRKLFLVGSTSKSHHTAEHRIGWAVCASTEDADQLKLENRNVVSSFAAEEASRQMEKECSVHSSITESFRLLKQGSAEAGFELVQPPRSVESSYVLIRIGADPGRSRRSLEHHGIAVMWGSEFGLTDEFVRLETSEPKHIRALVTTLTACLADAQSA